MASFRISVSLIIVLFLSTFTLSAQVLTSGSTDDGCQNVAESLSSITIVEQGPDDFNLTTLTPQTLVFGLTSGTFAPGLGNVTFTTGDVDAQISVTSSQVTVTLHAATGSNLSSGDALIITNLQVTSGSAETVEIRYLSGTAAVNGLDADEPVAYVSVNEVPAGVNDVMTICGDSQVNYDLQFNLTDLGNGVLSNFSWAADDNPNVSGENSYTSSMIDDMLSNVTSGAEVVTYRIIPTSITGNCEGPEFQLSVTVNPRVQIPGLTKSSTTINECINNSVTYTTDPGYTTYTWNITNEASITAGGTTSDNSITVQWPATATTGNVQITNVNSFGCATMPFGFNVEVQDNGPAAPGTTASAVCSNLNTSFDIQNHVTSLGNGSSGYYEFIAADNVVTTGEPLSPVSAAYINNAVYSPSGTVENIVYTVTGTNWDSGCVGAPFTVTIPINPMPIGATQVADQCSGAAHNINPQTIVTNFGNGLGGSSFTWSNVYTDTGVTGASPTGVGNITDILINASSDLRGALYEVIGTSSLGCIGPVFSVTAHAMPPPLIAGPASVCADAPFQFVATNPSGTFVWGNSGTPTNPSVSSGGTSTDDYVELTWPDTGVGSASVTYTNTYGCSGTAVHNVGITDQTPAGAADVTTTCSNIALTFDPQSTILALGNGVPATFSWLALNNTNTTGESISSQSSPLINDNLRNIQSSPELVVYTITPTGACGAGAPFTLTVTVNPEPVGAGGTDEVCSGTPLSYNLAGSVTNAVTASFEWIAADHPNVSGENYFTPNPSSIINDFVNLSENSTNEVVNYSVKPISLSGCAGDNFPVDITVQKAPSAPLYNADVCSASAANLDLQNFVNSDGNGVPSTFSWIAQSDNPNISGESLSSQNSATIGDVLVNATLFKQSVMYSVTATSVVANCTGSPISVLASVNPTPAGPANGSATLCSGSPFNYDIDATYTAGGNGVDATFEWSAADNANLSGETIALQNTTAIADVVTNATAAAENVVYTITPTSVVGGCIGTPYLQTITINPLPTTTINNLTTTLSNNGSTNITMTSNVAGATFSYVHVAPIAITGVSSGNGASIVQTLSNSTTSQQLVTYTVTATANGCTGGDFVTSVTVNGMRTIITADSVALVALYNSLGGATWTGSTNWLTGSANTWQGVDVSSEHVIGVSLPSNNLTGTLPAAFFNLSQLSLLDLQDNSITGSLPAEVSNLPSLQILDVRNNDLSGPLPIELYSLNALTQLRLSGNEFTGALLPSISNLTNLQTLQAEGLPMTGDIPTEVFGLTSLVNLTLSGKINGPLPGAIGDLTGLFTFSCDSCGITAVPSSITNLTNLISLRLNNNSIESLPNLSALPLSYLDVGKNSLTFESLEPHTSIGTFIYTPQDTVGAQQTVVLQTTTPYNFIAGVGGSANQYVWKKNNSTIASATGATYTLPAPVFEDEGTYHAEVTSTLLPGLTIATSPIIAKVSSLKRDSLSLRAIYDATNGPSWTTRGGWPNGNLATWTGVVISSSRVTALNLPNNNLTGSLPAEFTDLRSLQTANLSGNKISEIPGVVSMSALTNLNVASNALTFGSLEPNASVLAKLTYSPQSAIGTPGQQNLPAGSPAEFSAISSGANNVYQWKRNGTAVTGATSATLTIAALTRNNMGQYVCEITNTSVPGLTLLTAAKGIFATAELSGKVSIAANTPAQKGKVILLRVNPAAAFDTVSIKDIAAEGNYQFTNVVLDDYQIVAVSDRATHATALPTYYKNTIFWEEADTLFVNNDLTDLNITTIFEPAAPSGNGLISGTITEDDGKAPGGRTKLPKPVRQAGVSARRVQGTGRGQEEILILVAYVFTNDKGEFSLENLPPGNYRLNIQYPGYPMDETSFINFTIGTGLQSEVKVEAQVERGVINVRQLIITDLWTKENYSAEVFPNPTSSIIKMKFGHASSYRDIGIFDLTGKEIGSFNAADETLEIDVNNWGKGMYLLNVNEKGLLVKRLRVIIE